jgi:hypothetical protein
MLCLRSLELANKILKGNYISKVTIQYGEGHKNADFSVVFYGKKAKKNGKTTVKIWPIDHMASKNAELVDYAVDEIELQLARKHLGWDEQEIRHTNVEKSEDMMVLTFSVANLGHGKRKDPSEDCYDFEWKSLDIADDPLSCKCCEVCKNYDVKRGKCSLS